PGVGRSDAYVLRLGGLAPVAGLVLLVTLALLLCSAGWKAERAERFRLAAAYKKVSGTVSPQVLTYLDAAVRILPQDAALQTALADAHYEEFRQRAQQFDIARRFAQAAEAVLAYAPSAHPVLAAVTCELGTAAALEQLGKTDEQP